MLANWVDTLSNEIDDSNKALEPVDVNEASLEVANMGRDSLELEDMIEDSARKESIHQDNVVEPGSGQIPTVGQLLTGQ